MSKYYIHQEDDHYTGLFEKNGKVYKASTLTEAKNEVLLLYEEYLGEGYDFGDFDVYVCTLNKDADSKDSEYYIRKWSPKRSEVNKFIKSREKKLVIKPISAEEYGKDNIGKIRVFDKTSQLFGEECIEVYVETTRKNIDDTVLFIMESYDEEEGRIDFHVTIQSLYDIVTNSESLKKNVAKYNAIMKKALVVYCSYEGSSARLGSLEGIYQELHDRIESILKEKGKNLDSASLD